MTALKNSGSWEEPRRGCNANRMTRNRNLGAHYTEIPGISKDLLGLYPGALQHHPPADDLGGDESAELVGHAADGDRAFRVQAGAQLGRPRRAPDLRVEAAHDGSRCPGGRHDAVPAVRL